MLGKLRTIFGHRGVEGVIAQKPKWVRRQINAAECRAIGQELQKSKAATAVEIGVASGFSSAIIYAQLVENAGEQAKLFSFDRATACYFDEARNTGDAAFEIHGRDAHIHLTTGVSSGDVTAAMAPALADFLFIDANHRSPWATLDLLSLARFVRPGGVVALHDLEMPFTERYRADQNGPRDLYRCWRGEKWRHTEAPNLGFLRRGDDGDLLQSIVNSLAVDWDATVDLAELQKFKMIAKHYGTAGDAIIRAIEESATP